MRILLMLIVLVLSLVTPVQAMDFTAPAAPDEALDLMPVQPVSFGSDLIFVLKNAAELFTPELTSAAKVCLSLIVIALVLSVLKRFSSQPQRPIAVAAVVAVGFILLKESGSLINLSAETVRSISEYGKLLLPVLTAAMAAEGGGTASAALYAGTAFFDSVLSSLIASVLVPMVYMFLVLSVASGATGEKALKSMAGTVKSLLTWLLKTVLYVFTGYMGITGVVSGTADAAALKATKLTISGMVPVVGGILSDASEAVIVGAGVMKNAVGIYGLLAVIAILIAPFIKIGVQYLLLKATAAVCELFDVKEISEIINAFSSAMGLLLAMTGGICVMQLISIICFMKGFR